jgi:Trk-type K+ transport system membrane component
MGVHDGPNFATGATILTDIEALPRAHLFQRSLAQWVGGMGIIVLTVAILPELAVGGMQLFSAESSGSRRRSCRRGSSRRRGSSEGCWP